MKCYFCKTTGTENGVMLESTGITGVGYSRGLLICPQCKKEAIMFWKHHHELGLLE